MRKILLALMIMVSFSFAYPTMYNGKYVMNLTTLASNVRVENRYNAPCGSTTNIFINVNLNASTSVYTAQYPTQTGSYFNYNEVRNYYFCVYDSVSFTLSDSQCSASQVLINGQCVAIPTCTADEKLDTATNTCVPKTVDPNNADCDPVASQFTNQTTGKCEDCLPFSGFTSRASCACSAYGSTYTPAKGVAYYSTQGQYTYKKQRATCDDGTQIFIYYDPLNNNPQDYNNTTPTDSNNTTPTDNNSTTSPTDLNGTVVPDPTQADVVKALNAIKDGQKDSNTALKELGVDLKTINTSLKEQGYTFDSILNKIKEGNDKADARFKLMDDEYKGQTQYRNMMGKWVDQDLKNSTAQLGATVDIKNAVNGTTGAVNAQGEKISGKLDDILKAIKDGNGTDMSATNDLLEKIKGDTNATSKGIDKLHDDLNTTNDILGKIKGLFDNNDSFKTPDVNESKFELSDLLPDNNWFETNKLKLNFKNYGGGCYCQTAEFRVAGQTFVFPPQSFLDAIPFDVISKMFMAFIYVLGLRDFLRN